MSNPFVIRLLVVYCRDTSCKTSSSICNLDKVAIFKPRTGSVAIDEKCRMITRLISQEALSMIQSMSFCPIIKMLVHDQPKFHLAATYILPPPSVIVVVCKRFMHGGCRLQKVLHITNWSMRSQHLSLGAETHSLPHQSKLIETLIQSESSYFEQEKKNFSVI